jgi:hypothetical protein
VQPSVFEARSHKKHPGSAYLNIVTFVPDGIACECRAQLARTRSQQHDVDTATVDTGRAALKIAQQLKHELAQGPLPVRPEIDRALKRLLERDMAERSRPHQTWSGGRK